MNENEYWFHLNAELKLNDYGYDGYIIKCKHHKAGYKNNNMNDCIWRLEERGNGKKSKFASLLS